MKVTIEVDVETIQETYQRLKELRIEFKADTATLEQAAFACGLSQALVEKVIAAINWQVHADDDGLYLRGPDDIRIPLKNRGDGA